jgi:hypothetical protein
MEEIQKLELLVKILQDIANLTGRTDGVEYMEQLALVREQQAKINSCIKTFENMTKEISQKKLAVIQYIEHLSLQLLAHQHNKVNKDEGIYCETVKDAIIAINDMLPDDITEKLYEIYQTQVVEVSDEDVKEIDEDCLAKCVNHVSKKIDSL